MTEKAFVTINKTLSLRGREWKEFAEKVMAHIESYTVPQYGDKGGDLVSRRDAGWCVDQIEKYVLRFGTNARGMEDQLLDLCKIAHYACMAHQKLVEQLFREEAG